MKKALVVLLFSMVIGIGTANASITVDGIISPGTEWDTWFIHGSDINESTIANNYDIKEVYAWWDSTNVWIRSDVWGTPTLLRQDSSNLLPAFYQWTIDTDGDGIGELSVAYNRLDIGDVSLYDVSGATPVLLGAGIGANSSIVEVSFATSLVPSALAPTSDYDVQMFMILDNAGGDPDDRLPNAGWVKTVPEPNSMLMLGTGLIGLIGGAFRKKFVA